MLPAAAPILFVLIWSTGFIVARAVIPFVSPELFLAVRLISTTALLAGAALIARETWPRGRRLALHLVTGAMLHGVYLCASWWAVSRGMPAGIMSLLGSVQPLGVAVASYIFLHERLSGRNWFGLLIGIAGVGCVLAPTLVRSGAATIGPATVAAAVAAVLAMAAGTMMQRGPLSSDPILVAGAVQNAGGIIVALAAAMAAGQWRWENGPLLWLGLAWSVLVLSGAGLSLLVWMVRHQGAARVSTLLLLVPVLAAMEAWALFGERLGLLQIVGFLLALAGVLLARTVAKVAPTEPA